MKTVDEPLSTSDIRRACLSHPPLSKIHLGVCPVDFLMRHIPRTLPAHLIFNTDPSWEDGEHWLSIFFNKRNDVDVFDSLGALPDSWDTRLRHYLRACRVKKIFFLSHPVQAQTSNGCGLFALMHGYHRSHGVSFREFMKKFVSAPLEHNDKIVQCFFLNRLAKPNSFQPPLRGAALKATLEQVCRAPAVRRPLLSVTHAHRQRKHGKHGRA